MGQIRRNGRNRWKQVHTYLSYLAITKDKILVAKNQQKEETLRFFKLRYFRYFYPVFMDKVKTKNNEVGT
jgi:hypothetical protein